MPPLSSARIGLSERSRRRTASREDGAEVLFVFSVRTVTDLLPGSKSQYLLTVRLPLE